MENRAEKTHIHATVWHDLCAAFLDSTLLSLWNCFDGWNKMMDPMDPEIPQAQTHQDL